MRNIQVYCSSLHSVYKYKLVQGRNTPQSVFQYFLIVYRANLAKQSIDEVLTDKKHEGVA